MPMRVRFPFEGLKFSRKEQIPVKQVWILGLVHWAISLQPELVLFFGSLNHAVYWVSSSALGSAFVKKLYVLPAFHLQIKQLCPPEPSPPNQPVVTSSPFLSSLTVQSEGISAGLFVSNPLHTENSTLLSVAELTCMPKQPSPNPLAMKQLPIGSQPTGTVIQLQQQDT